MRSSRKLALLALCLAGCGGRQEPVARLSVEPRQVSLGYPEATEMRLTWEPLAESDTLRTGGATVFVHLLDTAGEIVRTFDHSLPDGFRDGTPVAYPLKLYQSALAPPLPAGAYRLTMGLYDGRGRKRWPLAAPGQDLGRHEYQVADVAVPAPRPGGPRFAFSPEWLPAEPGGDRQVLARRWLKGERGTVRATGLAGAGTLWLVIAIPLASPGQQLTILDGSGTPSAVVGWSCGGMETGLSGVGGHEIEMPAEEPPPGGTCDIEVRANFVLSVEGTPERRSVALENLAWDLVPAS
jgi:hypothetical protein